MTSPEPLIPRIPVRSLPIPLTGDLIIDFKNRDPEDPTQYLDYPAGAVGQLSICNDLKTAGAERVVVEAEPEGYHCVIKLDGTTHLADVKKSGTQWAFAVIYPDADLPGGYTKEAVNGLTVADDGKGV